MKMNIPFGKRREPSLPVVVDPDYAGELRKQIYFTANDLESSGKSYASYGDYPALIETLTGDLSERFMETMFLVAVRLAAVDGEISSKEAYVLNALFGKSVSQYEYNAAVYPAIREINIVDCVSAITVVEATFRFGTFGELNRSQLVGKSVLEIMNEIQSEISIANGTFDGVLEGLWIRVSQDVQTQTDRFVNNLAAMRQDEQGNQILDALPAPKPTVEGNAIPDTLEKCIAELHALVGLDNIKSEVETLINLARVFASRRKMRMPVPPMSHHLVLAGNPGTGKTSVARIISKVYHILGLLSTSKFVEVDRSGLVANFVGQTATKTKRVIDSAIGGVLFIDEAYALTRGTTNDYGDEAIEVILKAMEDNREDLIIIAAGYSEKMVGFLEFNPGLKSRFRQTLNFPDYTPDQMCEIFSRMATTNGYRLDLEAQSALEIKLESLWKDRDENFANARDVRNLFERAIARQADRIAAVGDYAAETLSLIKAQDISS